MLDKFRQNDVEYITAMLLAGLAMFIIFLPLDAWFGTCCFLAGIFFAVVMWFVSITLDTLEAQRQPKKPKEAP